MTETRPKRADARRNYERLLTEARAVFAARGTDASLEEIARRSGWASAPCTATSRAATR
ncbi:hypothetical protein ACFQ60_30155 [Streptomyces zhihengii]